MARGILTPESGINFSKDARSPINLKGSTKRPAANSVVRPDFKFEDLGIGGLVKAFSDIVVSEDSVGKDETKAAAVDALVEIAQQKHRKQGKGREYLRLPGADDWVGGRLSGPSRQQSRRLQRGWASMRVR